MLRIVRSFYQVGITNITSAPGLVGSTLQAGDVLYYNTTAQIYATVVGNALVFPTN